MVTSPPQELEEGLHSNLKLLVFLMSNFEIMPTIPQIQKTPRKEWSGEDSVSLIQNPGFFPILK